MSGPLHDEITRLSAEFKLRRIHDQDIIKELTLVLGYSYFIESEAQCRKQVHDHLLVLIDLLCGEGHLDLCKIALDILAMTAEARQPIAA
jgi:hypothetical protein